MKASCTIIILFLLSGCGFKDHNKMIERHNVAMFKAYSLGMAKQKSEGGRMAVAIAYLTRTGQQDFVRPETAIDYSNAFIPYANLFMNAYAITGRSQSPSYKVEGANNSLYVTNEKGSRNSSTLNRDSFNTQTEDYLLSGGNTEL